MIHKGKNYSIKLRKYYFCTRTSKNIEIRRVKYLNNIVEQDHRSVKRIITPMLGFQSFRSASKTLKGIEAMNMVKKGQVNNLNYSGPDEVKYINQLFEIVF